MPDPLWIFLPAVVALLPFFFMAGLNHDRLVRRLYDRYSDDWRKQGGPRGFFWLPPDGVLPGSGHAFIKSSMTWAFRLPAPLRADPEARRALFLMRLGMLVWNVGVIALIVTLVMRYGFHPI